MKSEEETALLMTKIRKILLTKSLNSWEKDFLNSVLAQLSAGKKLSEKQRTVLDKLLKK